MTARASRAATAALALAVAGCHHASPALTPASPRVVTIANAGFRAPENLVYDSAADVYLVSNMGGPAQTKDDDGFISRVAADGRVLDLRWIAGGRDGAVLDAPKGLAIRGDTLAVADLGGVHLFDRRTGAHLGEIALPGMVMNDLAFAPDGTLWITDTGPDRTTLPPDTASDMDAVWIVGRDGAVRPAARGLSLDRPDGIVLDGDGALVATFGAARVERVGPGRVVTATVATLPGGKVDGLRRMPDGSLVVTSWDARTVWRLTSAGVPRPLLTGVTTPAGVALDTRRHRLAVTSMQGNALFLAPLP